jgi:adenylate cyclase class 2
MAQNIEFKAKGPGHQLLRSRAQELGAELQGILHQHDTYFKVSQGRKKIRKIAGSHSELITYFRSDARQARQSTYHVKRLIFPEITKFMLKMRHGTLAEVVKQRELWLWKSVRIHLDKVEGLGEFMELEAVVSNAGSLEEAQSQCHAVMDKLEITEADMIASSYCDMLTYQ